MSKTEVLVLNGSPGSGKSTVAAALSELLREADQTHAVTDVDELARVYPESHGNIKWDNLAAVWQNYKLVPDIKVILPVCIDSEAELTKLKDAVPCETFTVCELTASLETLKARVTEREPNEYWQEKLRGLVEAYASGPRFGDFKVSTGVLSPEGAAKEIALRLGWLATK